MASQRKPRCFVAMAFDRADTDVLYSRQIEPMLRRNGVIPVIINRRQSNRDLNLQIIEQLDASDFCIADLTYTRPSVYFEAGYAQRQVSVIYTARGDHVRPGQPDDLRVHFDLQMKPIVLWSSPTDRTFGTRLQRRLRETALKEFAASRRAAEKSQLERRRFAAMSVDARKQGMLRAAIRRARKQGFDSWTISSIAYVWETKRVDQSLRKSRREFEPQVYKDPTRRVGIGSRWDRVEAQRVRNGVYQIVSVVATEACTKTFIRDYYRRLRLLLELDRHHSRLRLVTRRNTARLTQVEEHHVLLSLTRTPASRVMSALPGFHKGVLDGEFFRGFGGLALRDGGRDLPHWVTFYFCDAVDSERRVLDYVDSVVTKAKTTTQAGRI